MKKFIENNFVVIVLVIALLTFFKGCGDTRELSKIKKEIAAIKDSTYTKQEDYPSDEIDELLSASIKNTFSNLISEIIGTFVLVFVIFYLAGPSLDILGEVDARAIIGLGSIGAVPVAFLVWVIGLSLGGTTGYAINPARDLGPRIMHAILPIKGKSDWGYAWIPVIGPAAGAVLGAYLLTLN